jgi:hypothetical protein
MSRTYAFMVLGGAVLAVAAMERALITRDFSLEYVANNGSHSTPALFNVATLWSALEGSIMLWGADPGRVFGGGGRSSSATASTTRWWPGRWSSCSRCACSSSG